MSSVPAKSKRTPKGASKSKSKEKSIHKGKRKWVPTVPPPALTLRDPGLLERYKRIVLLNRDVFGWHFRPLTFRGWPLVKRVLGDADLLAHLDGGCWIGCRAPADGLTDRLAFDIDVDTEPGRAPTPEQLADRDRRYWLVRHALGLEHVPLVVRTPRGGLRVLYRIPVQPLAGLIDGLDEGLVPDVLRAVDGLAVANGVVEVFPQPRKVDRLPLGRAMPILCPTSLAVLAEAAVGPQKDAGFDEARLEGALALVERWHATPLDTLVPHLHTLPTVGKPAADVKRRRGRARVAPDLVVGPATDPGSLSAPDAQESAPEVPQRAIVLGVHRLVAPHTRHEVEWTQGLAMMVAPERFREFGLTTRWAPEQFAHALATWLMTHHDGYSEEWAAAVREGGSDQAARDAFTARYLRPDGADGSNMVQRLARIAESIVPTRRRVLCLSGAERRMYLAAVVGRRGAHRFRAEVWVLGFARLVQRLYRRAVRRGERPAAHQTESGRWVVRLRIPASWLEGLDYGKGAAKHAIGSPSRYREYLQLLVDAGLVRVRGGIVRPNSQWARTVNGKRLGLAQVYEVPLPNLNVTLGEVGVDPYALKTALRSDELTKYGRTIGLDQALHCLVLARDPQGVQRAYGRESAKWVRKVADHLAPGGSHAYGVIADAA